MGRALVFHRGARPHRRPVLKALRRERSENAAVRRELTRVLGPLWQNVADGFRMELDEGELAAAIARGAPDLEPVLARWDRRSGTHLAAAYRAAIAAGSRIGARHSGLTGGLEAPGLTARAERWVATEGARRITRINAATRGQVREVLASALRDELTPTRAAQEIGRHTGLTPAQSRALRRYEATLVERRIPTEQADTEYVREAIASDVERYRERLLRQRGSLIVETETQAAVQAGERLWWEEAGAQGRVSLERTTKRWATVQDERVCPICAPLHGVEIPFGELFSSGEFEGEGPPSHPGCRCFLEMSAPEGAEPEAPAQTEAPPEPEEE